MKRTLAISFVAALGLCTITACKKKDDAAKPAAVKVTEPTPAVVKPVTPPPPPAAPTYSPENAKAMISEMAKCSSEYGCDALATVVGFGAPVAPDLLTLVSDATATASARGLAALALGQLKHAESGLKLIAVANALTDADSSLQRDLYKGAGLCGGQPVFDALIGEYQKRSRRSTTIVTSRCVPA